MATSKVTDSRSVKFVDTVESSIKKGILLKAKHLVWQLGHLRIPQGRWILLSLDSLVLPRLQWIRAIRREATIIYSESCFLQTCC